MNASTQDSVKLNRAFGMREAVTLSVGNVMGVGLFVTGANAVGFMGADIIFATLVAFLITVYPAQLYAEMSSSLPYAGGTYKYASYGLGKFFGFLAGWNYVIAIICVAAAEAFAFSFYFKTMFLAFDVQIPISDTVIAGGCVAIFTISNVIGTDLTGKLQNAFMYFFWGVAIVWFFMMIPHVQLPNFVQKPEFLDMEGPGFIACVAMIWWCFAGFDACVSMGEEIKYPHINMPRSLIITPIVVFALNAIFQWFLVGIVPLDTLESLTTATAPYADAMMTAGILGIPLATLAAGIAFGGGLSTMNSCVAAPPRYLYAMARDGMLPKFLCKVHPKYKTPYIAIWLVGILAFALVSTNSIHYVAFLSLFTDLFYYVIGIAAALGLRKKYPDIKRPYMAKAVMLGVPVSIVLYLFMMTQLDATATVSGILWSVVGLLIFMFYGKKHSKESFDISTLQAELTEPSPEESVKMDKEYKLWLSIVSILSVVAIALYVFPHI